MARRVYPDERWTFVTNGVANDAVKSAAGRRGTFYTDSAGTVLADVRVRNTDGTTGAAYTDSAIPVGTDGLWPLFLGPDTNADTLYVKPQGSTVLYAVFARSDDRLDLLEATPPPSAVVDAVLNTVIDAKGDLIVGTAPDTVARQAVGGDDTLLVADAVPTNGVRWGSPTKFAPTGMTGAVSASRYVGGTVSGAPTTGTFAVRDFVISGDGHMWVCTVAGTPGTWVDAGSYGAGVSGIPATIVDAKGDLIVATAADTVSRLAVGTNGKVLTADSAQATGLTWKVVSEAMRVLDIEDYGAIADSASTTGSGTDSTTAIRNAIAAAIASTNNGWVNTRITAGLRTGTGSYRITGNLMDTPDVAGGAQTSIKGLVFEGPGNKRAFELFVDWAPSPSADPRVNNVFTLGNRAQGWRFRNMLFRGRSADVRLFYLWSRIAGGTQVYPAYGTGNNQDFGFEDVEFAGTWERCFGLDGDALANNNSEFWFDKCATNSGTSVFADAFFRAGITDSSTNIQQDQFLNYWTDKCKWEWVSGTLFKFPRGGNITHRDASIIPTSTSVVSTFMDLPEVPSHFEGVCRLLIADGCRAEIRSANTVIIDSHWTKGSIKFSSYTDGAIFTGASEWNGHRYDFNAGISRGPHVVYQDCEGLTGHHTYDTAASVATDGKAHYERVRFENYAPATVGVGTGAVRSTSSQVPYRFKDVWTTPDHDTSALDGGAP